MTRDDKIDADDLISAEKEIAAYLYDNASMMSKDAATEYGRDILAMVLRRFRPDLSTREAPCPSKR